jgi:hypothetical protein
VLAVRLGLSVMSEALIDEYDRAKKAYDGFLAEAYDVGQKWPEEQKKLYAREKTRKAGFKDPDTYRWLLRLKIGSIQES